jgi:L-asparaginase
MIENPETGALENFDMEQFRHHVPELKRFNFNIDAITFESPIDSSDMEPHYWVKIAKMISDNYDRYNGFVVLHGTDTMAYTASALSFMLENLGKPVIVTGSQLPIGKLRTDGKENLLTSIEIAAARNAQGEPMVPEVCIFFQSALMRGNRTTKINAEGFNAFRSYNFPPLAKAGIHIKYETHLIRRPDPSKPFKAHYLLDNNVLFLTLFPGIREEIADLVSQVKGLKAVILKTYGAGNAPQRPWLVSRLKRMTEQGMIVVNITQCSKGRVEMGLYETSLQLIDSGVLNGYDATPESMVTKLMFLLGHGYSHDEIVKRMNESLCGEITID